VPPDARDFADAQNRRGPLRVKEVATMLRAAFPDQAWEVHDVLAEGDQVVMHSTRRGTHEGMFMGIPPTHRSVETHHMYLFRLAEGKVTEFRAVRADLTMMSQLGLFPPRADRPASGSTR
jgi:predicted ester cyclase